MAYRPLADEIRPTTLDEVVGQKHILGKNGLLRRVIDSGNVPNLIFYGPSGTGKTTVANIIAQRTNRPLHRLNATTASSASRRGLTMLRTMYRFSRIPATTITTTKMVRITISRVLLACSWATL